MTIIYPFHCEEFPTTTDVLVEIGRSHVLINWVE